jgi:uncharacterized sulfatase
MKIPARFIHVLLFTAISFTTCKPEQSGKTNVLIILADDLGWNQLGCYGGPYGTPAIDSLASEGMRFHKAYAAAAVCSPTRAALMTGKYPARLHVTDFIKGGAFEDSLLVQPEWQKFLPLEEITLGEVFQQHGYRTALFGKWHLSQDKQPPESLPYNPDKQGFNEYMVTYKPRRGQSDPEKDPHNVDSIVDRSIQFLKANSGNPFLLIVSHNSIHDPIMEQAQRITRYEAEFPVDTYRVNPILGAMVDRLDEGTGRLLYALRVLGLEQNTLVIFCSDNGGKQKYAEQYPFRKGKGWLYEGGIRVPLIMKWPGRIKAGSDNYMQTSTIDLFPTLVELLSLPVKTSQVDGISMAGQILTGEPAETAERALFWHYPHYHGGSGMKPASAMRMGNYKLIEWHEKLLLDQPPWELYDIESDPGESADLSELKPTLVDSLVWELNQWRESVGAQMPTLE